MKGITHLSQGLSNIWLTRIPLVADHAIAVHKFQDMALDRVKVKLQRIPASVKAISYLSTPRELRLPQHLNCQHRLLLSLDNPRPSQTSRLVVSFLDAMVALTGGQLLGVEAATRTSSLISILGSLFIISSYLCLSCLRRPTTRLIFYATWGNMITNAATLVSVSTLRADALRASALCQVQAFLIQWFMLADPFWVVKRFDGSSKIPDYEKWYGLVAYGVPATVPIVYLVHDQLSSHSIMGSAILWCWVRKEFDWMRIAFFYAPMWILAVVTMSIHIWVGRKIYRAKMEMRKCRKESEQRFVQVSPGTLGDPFVDLKDQITVTTNISHADGSWSRSATPSNDITWLTPALSPRSPASQTMRPSDRPRSSTPTSPTTPGRHGLLVPLNPNSPVRHHNPLLIGKYRATAYAAPLASGDFATLPSPQVPVFRPAEHAAHVQRRRETAEAFRYFKSALLLFVALVVVWVPSSINRLYQLAHPDHPSYALNLISALVLPSQGFWNAVIYAHASWEECGRACAEARSKLLTQSSAEPTPVESTREKGSMATELSLMDSSEPNTSKLIV
ncbi:hypothetical protein E8E12_009153 [Didymella heteroderae]|uniref:G-protein coupled receptors family 2 profile 2 domain-containing protein n=1 Tax=Didymella heteroderae TaxID=1769908 RepID=A0A9P4WZ19_9PLEO|nr:hypothetical protein E8E12_009153 [Didymella heteroderae]